MAIDLGVKISNNDFILNLEDERKLLLKLKDDPKWETPYGIGGKDEVREMLNPEQQQIFDELECFLSPLNTKYKYYMLEGYAGTGKTFLIRKVISLFNRLDAAMTAPTNKAVKVLAEDKIPSVEYATIHKLLSLRVKWYPPKPPKKEPIVKLVPNGRPTIDSYDVLVIDEASMLSDDLFLMIDKILNDTAKVKIIFMGDPAQIPPVNQDDPIPLQEDGRQDFKILHNRLNIIMRQANGSQIVEIGYAIRQGRFRLEDPINSLRVTKGDIKFFYSEYATHRTEFVNAFLNLFKSEEFKQDSDYCKVIAWTNKAVASVNNIVRHYLFKGLTLEKIMVGEKLIAGSPIIRDSIVLFATADEFEVVELEKKLFTYDMKIDDGQKELDLKTEDGTGIKHDYVVEYYDAVVRTRVSEDEYLMRRIDILTEKGELPFKWLTNKLKRKASMEARKGNKSVWVEYFKLAERFANVKYSYAITAHSSQGSTYQHVFILEDDMDRNRKKVERNRIKYTAITRARKMCYILSLSNISSGETVKQMELF